MNKCRYCERELPGSEMSCAPCFESRYAAIDKPRSSIKDRVIEFVASPFGLKVEDFDTRSSFRADFANLIIGLLLCWLGGYAKLDYRIPSISEPVLHCAIFCLSLAVPLSLFLVRIGWKIYWRGFCAAFMISSFAISGWFFIGPHTGFFRHSKCKTGEPRLAGFLASGEITGFQSYLVEPDLVWLLNVIAIHLESDIEFSFYGGRVR